MQKISYEDVAIVLPAYNEQDTLRDTVEKIINKLEYKGDLIVVEDGCTDQTPKIAKEMEKEYDQIKHIHSDERLGKATAIKKGFENSNKSILAFADSDTPQAYKNIYKVVQTLKEEDNDLVIGDRNSSDSQANRGFLRKIHTTYTNKVIDKALKTGIKDHQCGFKAIKSNKYHQIKGKLKSTKWFLDIELIYYAQQNDYKIKSIPIEYESEDENSSAGPEIFLEFFQTLHRIKKEERQEHEGLGQYLKFGTIGGAGAMINMTLLYLLTEYLSFYYMFSAAISTEAAIITMFILNNRYTFKPIKQGIKNILEGILRSNIVRSLGVILQLALLYIFTEYLEIYYVISNGLAILLASILTFHGEKRYNWDK